MIVVMVVIVRHAGPPHLICATYIAMRNVPHASPRLADRIDRLNTAIGRAASWCALAIVLMRIRGRAAALRARPRLDLAAGVDPLAHAALFLLAAAWTLQEGGHVRVDVFYADASPRTKAWIDLLRRAVLLLPFMLALLWFALPYVARSWAILERSRETSGLPLVFLLKTLIPVFALLLALQGVAQAIRAARAAVSLSAPRGEAMRPR